MRIAQKFHQPVEDAAALDSVTLEHTFPARCRSDRFLASFAATEDDAATAADTAAAGNAGDVAADASKDATTGASDYETPFVVRRVSSSAKRCLPPTPVPMGKPKLGGALDSNGLPLCSRHHKGDCPLEVKDGKVVQKGAKAAEKPTPPKQNGRPGQGEDTGEEQEEEVDEDELEQEEAAMPVAWPLLSCYYRKTCGTSSRQRCRSACTALRDQKVTRYTFI
eukprot:TRINITY_DN90673_c0_g1_i1.p1 TRINITY_DN90673_c0_g1~~TRINITY_DN90673_c0_g1_i1.p1  ORF type:complete len:222 (+),score=48.50 TRINITY_DN90673_c0_g1_i1:135-800(+)